MENLNVKMAPTAKEILENMISRIRISQPVNLDDFKLIFRGTIGPTSNRLVILNHVISVAEITHKINETNLTYKTLNDLVSYKNNYLKTSINNDFSNLDDEIRKYREELEQTMRGSVRRQKENTMSNFFKGLLGAAAIGVGVGIVLAMLDD